VNRKVVTIPTSTIARAEDILEKHLGTYGPEGKTGGGIKLVGGSKWWRVRGRELEGEWIEVSTIMPGLVRTVADAMLVDAKGLPEADSKSTRKRVAALAHIAHFQRREWRT
jgi:hypothetical protein